MKRFACMAEQAERGKAFEYACLRAIYRRALQIQETQVISSSATQKAGEFYRDLERKDPALKKNLDLAAEAATDILFKYEPMLANKSSSPLFLSMQSDSEGQKGDVRDIICSKPGELWEIGLSCKHNHDAVKHSRLSMSIKFGQVWFETPNDPQYFRDIEPVFTRLEKLKKEGAKWNDMPDKAESVYVPVLDAFLREMERLNKKQPDIAKRLVKYMIGTNDFYKVEAVDKDRMTAVTPYNMNGILNQNCGPNKPESRIDRLPYPTEIVRMKRVNENKINVICDQGWSFNMRIHNASSKVETSLKFDVRVEGYPKEVVRISESWKKPSGDDRKVQARFRR